MYVHNYNHYNTVTTLTLTNSNRAMEIFVNLIVCILGCLQEFKLCGCVSA